MLARAAVNPGKNDRFAAMRYDSEFLKECVKKKPGVLEFNRENRIYP